MAKNHSRKNRFKYVLFAAACTASFALSGIAAACNNVPQDEDETEPTVTREDSQLLRNGNFEFFDVPAKKSDENAPVYLINSPNSWNHGGTSSYTMSGIIGTSKTAWDTIVDESLAEKLDVNNALESTASNYKEVYVDYNGLKSSDLLYKDTYAALNDSDNDDDDADPKAFIENPETHYNIVEKDGGLVYIDDENTEHEVYVDDNGDYYLEYDESTDSYSQPISHVLMLHNYATEHNGIAQNYSSVDISLPANTSAEISVWVKTVNLLYNQGKEVRQDKGANITVTHTAGSTALDNFAITNINTQKLIAENKVSEEDAEKYNGWVEYTIYVNSCDFAASTVSLELGLGETGSLVEGYAFFDDVTVKKFANLDDEDCTYSEYKDSIANTEYTTKVDGETRKASCTLLSERDDKIFNVDSFSGNEEIITERFSGNFHYLIDLASQNEYNNVTFGEIETGLTVDSGKYVSSTNNDIKTIGFGDSALRDISDAKLPTDFTSLSTERDLLALVRADHEFNSIETEHYGMLNEALASAKDLPNLTDADDKMVVMLSAYGAAYTTSFSLSLAPDSCQIISFWVKTYDMEGSTAATVKITEDGNESNSANISVDSTNVTTDIDDDNKDIYNGWVRCFFFVRNNFEESQDTDNTKKFNIDFSFGNTAISGTTVSAYKPGWVALANLQTLDIEPDEFSYTSSGTYSASITFNEDEQGQNHIFDEAYGSQAPEIENGIVDPSSYTGVNGSSSSIVNNGHVSIPFDDINKNGYAGLINRNYAENYEGTDWYSTILDKFHASSSLTALEKWDEVFGKNSVQPLIIVNKLRDGYVLDKGADEDTFRTYFIKNEDGSFSHPASDAEFDENTEYYSQRQVRNYGFISANRTFSANNYSTVSVRVKVSAGAVAYIYLADTSAGKNVLQFNAPSYSFYYDEDGNVLKAKLDDDATLSEKRANVLYTLRNDGLYQDSEGKLFANTWNYTKLYQDETLNYFDANGNAVAFDDLKGDTTYYADANQSREVNHFLVTTNDIKVYEYVNGNYYYIVEGETQNDIVTPFDVEYARYDYSEVSEEYKAVIDGNDPNVAEKWITVNFIIHTGSASKSYRLELWSGERENAVTEGNNDDGVILFDYSYTTTSNDDLFKADENAIIKKYQDLLVEKNLLTDGLIESVGANIDYYENLVAGFIGNGIDEDEFNAIKDSYTAHYYTYSLYDSAAFHPFNKDVNAASTGYDYTLSDYSESLAYLSYQVGDTYNVYADYATIDQNVSLDTTTDSDDEDEDDDEEESNASVWLLASSIILVIALLFAMISIVVKDTVKKIRRKKALSGTKYSSNYNKANRYIKKLGIKKEEIEEVEAPSAAKDATKNAESEATPDETDETAAEPEVVEESEDSAEPEVTETDAPIESEAEPKESEDTDTPENKE